MGTKANRPRDNHKSRSGVHAGTGANDPLEQLLRCYIDDFVTHNRAANVVVSGLRVVGVGLRPLVDHLTFRTLDVEIRAAEFLKEGYAFDERAGKIEYENWWGKVFRKPGYPTIFIDQAFEGARGKESVIPGWVQNFGDKAPHHVAILVDDLSQAIYYMEKQGIAFSDYGSGDRSQDLRHAFTKASERDGKSYSVLELIERHRGFSGFSIPSSGDQDPGRNAF